MKLINQSCEIVNQELFNLIDIKKAVEQAARVSYLSWNKTTEISYIDFVNRLISNKEYRPLEFGTVHLKIKGLDNLQDLVKAISFQNKWNPLWIHYNVVDGTCYCTLNYRYYLELFPEFPIEKYYTEEDNEYYPKRYTIHFTIARGILDEFRTHIGFSHMASSTRYCNYSKDKFGNELTFIKPNWYKGSYEPDTIYENNDTRSNYFNKSCEDAEKWYLELLKEGCKPQEAREVLPLSIESHLFMCGFADMWKNFFKLRCANSAHPMAREIALEAQKKLGL